MDVGIRAGQESMPAGLSNLLNLASQGVLIESEEVADSEEVIFL